MRVTIVSSSLDDASLSERLAALYASALAARGCQTHLLSLKQYPLPRFDNSAEISQDDSYRELHRLVLDSDGVVLAGPVYNWSHSSELKRFIEIIGTTPPDRTLRSAFFDKVVSFAFSGGLPQSYMSVSSLAIPMMFDFKCLINPYHVYIDQEQWVEGGLGRNAMKRVERSASVKMDLLKCLAGRTYSSDWEL